VTLNHIPCDPSLLPELPVVNSIFLDPANGLCCRFLGSHHFHFIVVVHFHLISSAFISFIILSSSLSIISNYRCCHHRHHDFVSAESVFAFVVADGGSDEGIDGEFFSRPSVEAPGGGEPGTAPTGSGSAGSTHRSRTESRSEVRIM